ncbi:cytochrome b/b6 domain-containing protein [Chelativorans sp.]|uniref:cytochrome b n=1 Tax=Chelativorans sp. TaxID=2203393 RepID=UPI002810A71A|nr:cytochrome b/b6 domain-containing protein [Chelativorans sp.]
MPLRPPQGYSAVQIWLHWIIAGLIFFQLLVNDGVSDAWGDRADGERIQEGLGWANLHIGVGVTVLALAAVRVFVRLTRGAPPAHRDKPAPLIWLGQASHVALYFLILAMPISGAVAWFGRVDDAADAHEVLKNLLIALVALHVIGALGEHFVFRNDTLLRMLARVPAGSRSH